MLNAIMIIIPWPKGWMASWTKNYKYVSLTRVRSLDGLYLLEPIDSEKLFKSPEKLIVILVIITVVVVIIVVIIIILLIIIIRMTIIIIVVMAMIVMIVIIIVTAVRRITIIIITIIRKQLSVKLKLTVGVGLCSG